MLLCLTFYESTYLRLWTGCVGMDCALDAIPIVGFELCGSIQIWDTCQTIHYKDTTQMYHAPGQRCIQSRFASYQSSWAFSWANIVYEPTCYRDWAEGTSINVSDEGIFEGKVLNRSMRVDVKVRSAFHIITVPCIIRVCERLVRSSFRYRSACYWKVSITQPARKR